MKFFAKLTKKNLVSIVIFGILAFVIFLPEAAERIGITLAIIAILIGCVAGGVAIWKIYKKIMRWFDNWLTAQFKKRRR